MSDTRIFTVDKFLGINESADGTTELKLGEASKIENFYITDGYNLKTRPGIRRFRPSNYIYDDIPTTFLWSGYLKDMEVLIRAGNGAVIPYAPSIGPSSVQIASTGNLSVFHILQMGKDVYILAKEPDTDEIYALKAYWHSLPDGYWYLDFKMDESGRFLKNIYIPRAITGCKPDSAGGTILEKLNILTDLFRVLYQSENKATDYVLPEMAADVVSVNISGFDYPAADVGSYNKETHTFTLLKAPTDGVDVEITCATDNEDLRAARSKFIDMRNHEYYNGATDTRIFFYGDGTNVCYYTDTPAFGAGLYVPAGNELAVDFSDAPITDMVRHYSRLLVFKPDGVESIVYEPVTLEDGRVIAGFYLRPVSREFGNEATGQVALVNNYPRSFSRGALYEWRVTSNSYRDERYAKCISDKIVKTLEKANASKLVTFDDDRNKTYYIFLNDEEGTVLVNRYEQDTWSVYKSEITKNVAACVPLADGFVFLAGEYLYRFDEESAYDSVPGKNEDGDVQIKCVWESGYMAFGADYKRKYSSNLWVSLLPDYRSWLEVTVQTDKRSEYLTKTISNELFGFPMMDFENFSFQTYSAPKIRRIKLKVKKFVYYKLIMKVTKSGATATVLGYDQQVRYSSNVK